MNDSIFLVTDFYILEKFLVPTTENLFDDLSLNIFLKRFIPGKRGYENIKGPKLRLYVSCKSQSCLGLTQSHKSPWQWKWAFDFWGWYHTGRHNGMVFFSVIIKVSRNKTHIWFAHHMQGNRAKGKEMR